MRVANATSPTAVCRMRHFFAQMQNLGGRASTCSLPPRVRPSGGMGDHGTVLLVAKALCFALRNKGGRKRHVCLRPRTCFASQPTACVGWSAAHPGAAFSRPCVHVVGCVSKGSRGGVEPLSSPADGRAAKKVDVQNRCAKY